MNTLTISLAMIAIIGVGSFSLILAINHDTANLENDVKVIRIQENVTEIETTEILPEIKQYPQTTITKLDDKSSVKSTISMLTVPENNTYPFGFINGKVNNPTIGYPVILQIYKYLEEGPIHIAQVDLKEDNTFEYSFRVLTVEDGITTHLYEGDYFIKVVKVVNTPIKDQT